MIVDGVVDAAETQRWPQLAALGGVVVDHVQQHFDPGLVQRAREQVEFANVGTGEEAAVGRKEADRVVTPVVAEAGVGQAPLVHACVHWQQLDRSHAKIEQVRHHRRLGEAAKTAAQRLRHARMQARVTAGVQLVNHTAPPWPVWPTPRNTASRRLRDHNALGDVAGAVAAVEGQIAARVAYAVAVQRVVPAYGAMQQPRVRVD